MSSIRLLLCSDMDRTIIPNGTQPESAEARPLLHRLCRRDDVSLVYVTGRDIGLVEEAIVDFSLPRPDFVITDVGTAIYQAEGEEWRHRDSWSEHIAADWRGISGSQAMASVMSIVNALPEVAHKVVAQEDDRQSEFKVSFYTGVELESHILTALATSLEEKGLRCNLVWSVDEALQRGLLDVLPASASKLHAIRYLQQQLGVDDRQLLFAGDSGNDLEVLVSGINSVLVANASSRVRETALRLARDNGTEPSLYMASGSEQTRLNGNYAAGVIEGVMHFVPSLQRFWQEGSIGREDVTYDTE